MINVQGLTKYYGPRRAVDQVSFRVKQGEVVGLLGLNGSGKTTILRILAGDLIPTAGSVMINNIDLLDDPQLAKQQLSFLPETPPLYGEMTVKAYLQFVGRLKGMSPREVSDRLPEVVARTSIGEVYDEIIDHLSFGYRQRVGIAMSLIHDPKVLLLDEPAAGLDPVQIVDMRQLVRSLKGTHTVIFSSHFLSEISQICDRILVIQDGEIIGEGSEEDLSRQFTRQLRVRMQIRGPGDEIAKCLGGLSAIREVELVREEEGILTLFLILTKDIREGIVESMVGSGYGILEMTRMDLELESVFLQLMEKGGKAT